MTTITVSQKARLWFEEEMGIGNGRGVRFMSKVYGCSPIHDSFSLAIEVNTPSNPYTITIENNIPYYIETGDEWFFENYDLHINFNDKLNEPEYEYIPLK